MCTIEKIIDETPTVRTLIFSDQVLSKVLPGQFAMVWIPGINELPMSVMVTQENGKAAFTVRKRGESSTGMYNLSVGDYIGVRGPYGNCFDIKDGKLLLVGGGTGLVPLLRLITFCKPSHEITLLIGSQTKEEVFFEDLANKLLEKNKHQIIMNPFPDRPCTSGPGRGLSRRVTHRCLPAPSRPSPNRHRRRLPWRCRRCT